MESLENLEILWELNTPLVVLLPVRLVKSQDMSTLPSSKKKRIRRNQERPATCDARTLHSCFVKYTFYRVYVPASKYLSDKQ